MAASIARTPHTNRPMPRSGNTWFANTKAATAAITMNVPAGIVGTKVAAMAAIQAGPVRIAARMKPCRGLGHPR